ncbi:Innexin inx2 [Portunus trituberculatus]|uniref:Innexin inx2 n=1 Tax=Portunus trituberculatus TaxID=210409 RepID=A0A5B7EZL3_PORTR|nr:Innexin inx2 [Portunus trituberculatus]
MGLFCYTDLLAEPPARGRWAGRQNLDLIAKKCNLGDWFLIYHLGRNMEPMVYGEFLKEFAKELENSVSTLERKPMTVLMTLRTLRGSPHPNQSFNSTLRLSICNMSQASIKPQYYRLQYQL